MAKFFTFSLAERLSVYQDTRPRICLKNYEMEENYSPLPTGFLIFYLRLFNAGFYIASNDIDEQVSVAAVRLVRMKDSAFCRTGWLDATPLAPAGSQTPILQSRSQ